MNELALQLRQKLDAEGSACLLVTGHSMVPMLRNRRDTVTLVPVSRPLKVGDLIFYQRPDGQLVLHRVIRVKESQLICSGDHQYTQEAVDLEQVLAVVNGFERAGRSCSVSSRAYRLYVAAVTSTFPIRRPLLAVRALTGKTKRFLRRLFLF